MDVSSGDSEQRNEVALTVKDKPMHQLYQTSYGGEENLALGNGKKKLCNKMHAEFDGQTSKKRKKSHPVSKSNNVAASDPDLNYNSASSKRVRSKVEAKTSAMTRAEEVQSSLGTKFPTFIKPMLKSHVTGGYWLGVPVPFCKSHLPENDMYVTLENETRERFQTKYLAYKQGLSGGWRNFAITQKLVEGDVVVFQLVKYNKFKVNIIKGNDFKEADVALSLVNVDARGQQNDTEKDPTENCQDSLTQKITKRKRSKSLQSSKVGMNKKTDPGKPVAKTLQLSSICKNSDKITDLETIPRPSSPSSQFQFEDVKNFKDFIIVVDELCIDPELPDDIRAKYYALCSAKKSFLHNRLMQGLNSKLIAGIISEVVVISDSLKQCSLTTCRDEFANWEKALKSFKFLGMSVGFLRSRIRKIVGEFESEGAIEARKYIEAKLRRVRAEDEMKSMDSKLIELEEIYKKYDNDVKARKSRADSYERKFLEDIDAPW